MIIITHVLLAVLTSVISLFSLFAPSKLRLSAAKLGVALTLISGVAAVAVSGKSVAHLCISGAVFLTLNLAVLYFANSRFATQNI